MIQQRFFNTSRMVEEGMRIVHASPMTAHWRTSTAFGAPHCRVFFDKRRFSCKFTTVFFPCRTIRREAAMSYPPYPGSGADGGYPYPGSGGGGDAPGYPSAGPGYSSVGGGNFPGAAQPGPALGFVSWNVFLLCEQSLLQNVNQAPSYPQSGGFPQPGGGAHGYPSGGGGAGYPPGGGVPSFPQAQSAPAYPSQQSPYGGQQQVVRAWENLLVHKLAFSRI